MSQAGSNTTKSRSSSTQFKARCVHQSILEQKMALAAYCTENNIAQLTPAQLELAGAVLSPVEEVTKSISKEILL